MSDNKVNLLKADEAEEPMRLWQEDTLSGMLGITLGIGLAIGFVLAITAALWSVAAGRTEDAADMMGLTAVLLVIAAVVVLVSFLAGLDDVSQYKLLAGASCVFMFVVFMANSQTLRESAEREERIACMDEFTSQFEDVPPMPLPALPPIEIPPLNIPPILPLDAAPETSPVVEYKVPQSDINVNPGLPEGLRLEAPVPAPEPSLGGYLAVNSGWVCP